VDGSFGLGFSLKLDGLKISEWQGPVESGLGLHLVRLQSRTEGTLPKLPEIKPVVEREWANEKRLETRRMINEQLLKNYEVEIEWPRAQVSAAP
jgi:parvulin-like peptidyl-prolyl isomerase